MNKANWTIHLVPREATCEYYYANYSTPPVEYPLPIVKEALVVKAGVYTDVEIPDIKYTHIEVDYEKGLYDDSVDAIILTFKRYGEQSRDPQYEEKLAKHNKKKQEAEQKANRVKKEWEAWKEQQVKDQEYAQYLKLKSKFE